MKILIVGGVAAGMSAAARLRRLDEDAEIIVFEKSGHVSFANCGLPYHIGGEIADREKLLLQTPETLRQRLNLNVRVKQEVTGIDRSAKKITVHDIANNKDYQENYDKLVLCPGAVPFRPELPGIGHPKIFVLRNVEDMDRIIGEFKPGKPSSAVIIGGGYIGVEMAENLRLKDIQVDLVEMLDQLMPPLDFEMVREMEDHMRANGVKIHLGTAAAAFKDKFGKVSVELKNTEIIDADFVILSIGVRPDTSLAVKAGLELGPRSGIMVNKYLQTSDPDIYAAGDAIEVFDAVTGQLSLIPLAGPANRQGRIIADNISGAEVLCPATQGTAIVKVFKMAAACTGASEKTLKKFDVPYMKIYLHPSSHAGYYPNATPIHLKLLFSPADGKVLGAQAVGYDGIDKRIDVIATAIKAGMTVYDLQNLELCYAPPFGSAKDAVNMAGFVAANLLDGKLDCWYPEDFPEKTSDGVIIDVRPMENFDVKHIPGAISMPIGKLRENLEQIPRDKDIYLYCSVGFDSYAALRILKQKGFGKGKALKTLTGGIRTFSLYHKPETTQNLKERELAQDKTTSISQKEGEIKMDAETILDTCGMQCPGPIMKLKQAIEKLSSGNRIKVLASDPGFKSDIEAWCKQNGHKLLSVSGFPPKIEALILKSDPSYGDNAPAKCETAASPLKQKTIVVFSGDLDKVLAAFVIANGAIAMGSKVTLFFTFWGLNALRKDVPQSANKSFMDSMFGMMMPKGPGHMKLSKMNMLGMGTEMMKMVMKNKKVDSLPELMDSAIKSGARLVACSMSMDVMGLKKEELIDGIEIGGVATFLQESDKSSATLFI